MSAPQRLIGSLCASVLIPIAAVPASAASNSFSYPAQAAAVFGGAAANVSVNLPGAGTPSFVINFVLPRDYVTDGKVTIVLYLSTAVGPCTARIVAPQLARRRIGAQAANGTSGLSAGSPTVDIGAELTVGKTVALRPGDVLDGQRPGDSIQLQFIREADDPTDTCNGSVFVQAIDIRYPI